MEHTTPIKADLIIMTKHSTIKPCVYYWGKYVYIKRQSQYSLCYAGPISRHLANDGQYMCFMPGIFTVHMLLSPAHGDAYHITVLLLGDHCSPVDSPDKGPVMRSFFMFLLLLLCFRPNKLLNTHSSCPLFEMLWYSWGVAVIRSVE